jgi:FtsZ-interacting cell division protein ZipA
MNWEGCHMNRNTALVLLLIALLIFIIVLFIAYWNQENNNDDNSGSSKSSGDCDFEKSSSSSSSASSRSDDEHSKGGKKNKKHEHVVRFEISDESDKGLSFIQPSISKGKSSSMISNLDGGESFDLQTENHDTKDKKDQKKKAAKEVNKHELVENDILAYIKQENHLKPKSSDDNCFIGTLDSDFSSLKK